jgi:hypothetical protein
LLLFLRKKTILGETDKNPPGQKPSRQKWEGGQNPFRENDRADKSPPMKMTRRTKALPWKWLGGQKPSREINKADKSPPVTKINVYMYIKYLCFFFNALKILKVLHIFLVVFNWPKYVYEPEPSEYTFLKCLTR